MKMCKIKLEQNDEHTLALKSINKAHYILIVTHINPDADTIGSALALSNYFSENKIKHKVFNKHNIPRNLDFLDKFGAITNQLPKFYDLVIYVDCATSSRIGVELDNDIKIINFDHHKSNEDYGNINIVYSKYASCGEVIYEFFVKNNLAISKRTAQCLYTAIYEDSLKFSTPRTTQKTFSIVSNLIDTGLDVGYISTKLNKRDSLAKYRLLPKILDSLELHFEGKIATVCLLDKWLIQTGASYMECEGVADMILNIGIVDIALFFRETQNGIRVSLRGKNNVDILSIAQYFDGGGHPMVAGCTCQTNDILEAKQMILNYINSNLLVT